MEEAAVTSGIGRDPYQHEQLHEPTTHIRLLKLSPYKDDFSPLSGELISVALDNVPPYMALSYVWGPETPMVPISLHDKPFTVHQNLYAFLWHYLRLGRKALLWADALCINQNDPIEKAFQVNQMGKIYKSASAVVVWLGAPESAVMDALNFLSSYINDQNSIQALIDKYAYLFKNNSNRFSNAIMRFSENPYWTRLWIVQEFTLARKLYVQYGFTWIEWEDFFKWMRGDGIYKVIEAVKTNITRPDDSGLLRPPRLSEDVVELVEQRGRRQNISERGSDTLMDLIYANREKNCKDPRDRVYGLLALLDRERPGAEGITANYQIDAVELYFRLLEAQNPLIMNECPNSCHMWKRLLEALELDQSAISHVPHHSFVAPGPCADSLFTSSPILIHARPSGHVDTYSCSTIPNNTGGKWNICFYQNIHESRQNQFKYKHLAISPTAFADKHVVYYLHSFEAIGFVRSSCLEKAEAELKYQERTAKLLTSTMMDSDMVEALESTILEALDPKVTTIEAEFMQMTKTRLAEEFAQRIKDSGLFDIGEIKVSHIPSTGDLDPRHRGLVLEVDRHTFANIVAIESQLRNLWRTWSKRWIREMKIKVRREARWPDEGRLASSELRLTGISPQHPIDHIAKSSEW